MTDQQLLSDLIEARRAELGLSEREFFHAIGIRNPNKGPAMMEHIRTGRMKSMVHMRRQIATALQVSIDEIDAAIDASTRWRAAMLNEAWRAAFRPHAVLTTSREIPSPIFAAALTGAERKLYVSFLEGLPELRWPEHVAALLPEGLPGFGRVTGFVINYTPDRAVRFDREARPVETLKEAYRRGSIWMRGISAAAIGVPE